MHHFAVSENHFWFADCRDVIRIVPHHTGSRVLRLLRNEQVLSDNLQTMLQELLTVEKDAQNVAVEVEAARVVALQHLLQR